MSRMQSLERSSNVVVVRSGVEDMASDCSAAMLTAVDEVNWCEKVMWWRRKALEKEECSASE